MAIPSIQEQDDLTKAVNATGPITVQPQASATPAPSNPLENDLGENPEIAPKKEMGFATYLAADHFAKALDMIEGATLGQSEKIPLVKGLRTFQDEFFKSHGVERPEFMHKLGTLMGEMLPITGMSRIATSLIAPGILRRGATPAVRVAATALSDATTGAAFEGAKSTLDGNIGMDIAKDTASGALTWGLLGGAFKTVAEIPAVREFRKFLKKMDEAELAKKPEIKPDEFPFGENVTSKVPGDLSKKAETSIKLTSDDITRQMDDKMDELIEKGVPFKEAGNHPEYVKLSELRNKIDTDEYLAAVANIKNSTKNSIGKYELLPGKELNLGQDEVDAILKHVYGISAQGATGAGKYLTYKNIDDIVSNRAETLKKISIQLLEKAGIQNGFDSYSIISGMSGLTESGKKQLIENISKVASKLEEAIYKKLKEAPSQSIPRVQSMPMLPDTNVARKSVKTEELKSGKSLERIASENYLKDLNIRKKGKLEKELGSKIEDLPDEDVAVLTMENIRRNLTPATVREMAQHQNGSAMVKFLKDHADIYGFDGPTVNKMFEPAADLGKKMFRNLSMPMFLAKKHPTTFGPVFDSITQGIGIKDTMRSRAMQDGFKNLKDFYKLPDSSKQRIFNVLHLENANRTGERSTFYNDLADSEKLVYNQLRQGIWWGRYALREALLHKEGFYKTSDPVAKFHIEEYVNGRIGKPVLADPSDTNEATKQIIDWSGGSIPGHIPTARLGRHLVIGKDAAGETIYLAKRKTRAEAQKHLNELKNNPLFTNLKLAEESGIEMGNFYKTSVSELEQLALRSGVSVKDETYTALTDQLLKETVFTNLLERKDIPGYDMDWKNSLEAIKRFTDASASMYGKTVGLTEASKHLGQIAGSPIKKYADDFTKVYRDATNSDTEQLVRTAIGTWYLGGKFGFWAQNIMQPLLTTWPELYRHAGPGQAEGIFLRNYGKAWKMATRLIQNKPIDDLTKNANLRTALKEAWHAGILGSQFVNEALPHRGNDIIKGLGLMAAHAEQVNRTHAFLSGWDIAVNVKNLSGDAATKFAMDMADITQFRYGIENLPLFVTDAGKIRPFLRTAAIFQSFAPNMMHRYSRTLLDYEAGQTALRKTMEVGTSLAGLAGFSGVRGLPFYGLAAWGLSQWGINPELSIKQSLDEIGVDSDMQNVITRGLPTIAGIDVSRMMGLGDFPSRYLGVDDDQKSNPILLATGAAGQIVADGMAGVRYLSQGDFLRGAEKLSPKFLSTIFRSARWLKEEGIKSPSGKTIVPKENLTARDVFLNSLNIGTTNVNLSYERLNNERDTIEHLNKTSTSYLEKLAKAIVNKDYETSAAIRAKIREYNYGKPGAEKIIINSEALSERITNIKLSERGLPPKSTPRRLRSKFRNDAKYFEASYAIDDDE